MVTFFKQSSWILHKMFVLMSSRSSSKLGHLVSKTRSPGQISGKLFYNHFELWSECLLWSVLDEALKVLCCSGERYRAIMALLFSKLYVTIIPHWIAFIFGRDDICTSTCKCFTCKGDNSHLLRYLKKPVHNAIRRFSCFCFFCKGVLSHLMHSQLLM